MAMTYASTGTSSVIRFTGQVRDSETALDYFGARYLSGGMGRFTTPDGPLVDQSPGDPQSWNLYSYVRNNPIMNIDPVGRSCQPLNSVAPNGGQYDDGDGQGCGAAGVQPDSKGGLNASAQRVNVYGGPNAAGLEVSDVLRAFGSNGPKVVEYGPDDPFTKSFQQSIGMEAIRAGVKKNCSKESGGISVGTGEAFVNALIDGVVGGLGFYNPNAQLGAFTAIYERSGGTLNVTVTNPVSLNSAAYHITSKLGMADPHAGPFGTLHQTMRIRASDPCSAQ